MTTAPSGTHHGKAVQAAGGFGAVRGSGMSISVAAGASNMGLRPCNRTGGRGGSLAADPPAGNPNRVDARPPGPHHTCVTTPESRHAADADPVEAGRREPPAGRG